jgi:phage-related protein
VGWVQPRRSYEVSARSPAGDRFALYRAQEGAKHPNAKPLQGFGGAGVLELVEDFDGDAYRAVYTVKFVSAIYVLHAFQKKSKRGRQTTKQDMALIRNRLRWAEALEADRKD